MSTVCKICSSPAGHVFSALILGKYQGELYCCTTCGFLSVLEPFWLNESYASAITYTDTGLVSRNVVMAKISAALLYVLLGERGEGRYLDVAGGYGLFTRLMRDYGFDFYWSDKYCQNLMARGFEYHPDLGRCTAITAIEVLEHTENPVEFIRDVLETGQTDTLIFTTELYHDSPPPVQWPYYSFDTGQHISFFKQITLEALARRMGLHFASNGYVHLFSRNNYNQFIFRACTGRLAEILSHWIRMRLGTLEQVDHDILCRQRKQ